MDGQSRSASTNSNIFGIGNGTSAQSSAGKNPFQWKNLYQHKFGVCTYPPPLPRNPSTTAGDYPNIEAYNAISTKEDPAIAGGATYLLSAARGTSISALMDAMGGAGRAQSISTYSRADSFSGADDHAALLGRGPSIVGGGAMASRTSFLMQRKAQMLLKKKKELEELRKQNPHGLDACVLRIHQSAWTLLMQDPIVQASALEAQEFSEAARDMKDRLISQMAAMNPMLRSDDGELPFSFTDPTNVLGGDGQHEGSFTATRLYREAVACGEHAVPSGSTHPLHGVLSIDEEHRSQLLAEFAPFFAVVSSPAVVSHLHAQSMIKSGQFAQAIPGGAGDSVGLPVFSQWATWEEACTKRTQWPLSPFHFFLTRDFSFNYGHAAAVLLMLDTISNHVHAHHKPPPEANAPDENQAALHTVASKKGGSLRGSVLAASAAAKLAAFSERSFLKPPGGSAKGASKSSANNVSLGLGASAPRRSVSPANAANAGLSGHYYDGRHRFGLGRCSTQSIPSHCPLLALESTAEDLLLVFEHAAARNAMPMMITVLRLFLDKAMRPQLSMQLFGRDVLLDIYNGGRIPSAQPEDSERRDHGVSTATSSGGSSCTASSDDDSDCSCDDDNLVEVAMSRKSRLLRQQSEVSIPSALLSSTAPPAGSHSEKRRRRQRFRTNASVAPHVFSEKEFDALFTLAAWFADAPTATGAAPRARPPPTSGKSRKVSQVADSGYLRIQTAARAPTLSVAEAILRFEHTRRMRMRLVRQRCREWISREAADATESLGVASYGLASATNNNVSIVSPEPQQPARLPRPPPLPTPPLPPVDQEASNASKPSVQEAIQRELALLEIEMPADTTRLGGALITISTYMRLHGVSWCKTVFQGLLDLLADPAVCLYVTDDALSSPPTTSSVGGTAGVKRTNKADSCGECLSLPSEPNMIDSAAPSRHGSMAPGGAWQLPSPANQLWKFPIEGDMDNSISFADTTPVGLQQRHATSRLPSPAAAQGVAGTPRNNNAPTIEKRTSPVPPAAASVPAVSDATRSVGDIHDTADEIRDMETKVDAATVDFLTFMLHKERDIAVHIQKAMAVFLGALEASHSTQRIPSGISFLVTSFCASVHCHLLSGVVMSSALHAPGIEADSLELVDHFISSLLNPMDTGGRHGSAPTEKSSPDIAPGSAFLAAKLSPHKKDSGLRSEKEVSLDNSSSGPFNVAPPSATHPPPAGASLRRRATTFVEEADSDSPQKVSTQAAEKTAAPSGKPPTAPHPEMGSNGVGRATSAARGGNISLVDDIQTFRLAKLLLFDVWLLPFLSNCQRYGFVPPHAPQHLLHNVDAFVRYVKILVHAPYRQREEDKGVGKGASISTQTADDSLRLARRLTLPPYISGVYNASNGLLVQLFRRPDAPSVRDVSPDTSGPPPLRNSVSPPLLASTTEHRRSLSARDAGLVPSTGSMRLQSVVNPLLRQSSTVDSRTSSRNPTSTNRKKSVMPRQAGARGGDADPGYYFLQEHWWPEWKALSSPLQRLNVSLGIATAGGTVGPRIADGVSETTVQASISVDRSGQFGNRHERPLSSGVLPRGSPSTTTTSTAGFGVTTVPVAMQLLNTFCWNTSTDDDKKRVIPEFHVPHEVAMRCTESIFSVITGQHPATKAMAIPKLSEILYQAGDGTLMQQENETPDKRRSSAATSVSPAGSLVPGTGAVPKSTSSKKPTVLAEVVDLYLRCVHSVTLHPVIAGAALDNVSLNHRRLFQFLMKPLPAAAEDSTESLGGDATRLACQLYPYLISGVKDQPLIDINAITMLLAFTPDSAPAAGEAALKDASAPPPPSAFLHAKRRLQSRQMFLSTGARSAVAPSSVSPNPPQQTKAQPQQQLSSSALQIAHEDMAAKDTSALEHRELSPTNSLTNLSPRRKRSSVVLSKLRSTSLTSPLAADKKVVVTHGGPTPGFLKSDKAAPPSTENLFAPWWCFVAGALCAKVASVIEECSPMTSAKWDRRSRAHYRKFAHRESIADFSSGGGGGPSMKRAIKKLVITLPAITTDEESKTKSKHADGKRRARMASGDDTLKRPSTDSALSGSGGAPHAQRLGKGILLLGASPRPPIGGFAPSRRASSSQVSVAGEGKSRSGRKCTNPLMQRWREAVTNMVSRDDDDDSRSRSGSAMSMVAGE